MRTRFAPSPTGYLHLGHAFSALTAADLARRAGGEFLVRIEDIDRARCRDEYEQAIYDDLHWLGLRWPLPVMRQSERMKIYDDALNRLIARGLCFPCGCTRRDIRKALSAPQEGAGLDGPVYPGTCRARSIGDYHKGDAIRLNMAAAIESLGGDTALAQLTFTETGPYHGGTHRLHGDWLRKVAGDIVLARRDIGTSYHLAVVVDDAAQDITLVTRGMDLFPVTFLHRLLQALLELPTPKYHHHRLIRDESGKRLAKRDDARALRKYRADGATPGDIRAMLGLPAGG